MNSRLHLGSAPLLLLALGIASVNANPLLHANGFMSSEKLTIALSADQAEINGVFTWKSVHPIDAAIANKFLASLQIPLWIPAEVSTPPERPLLEIKGSPARTWRQPAWRSPRFTQGFEGLTTPEPGFHEWVCEFLLRSTVVANEEPVAITYKQPLRKVKTGALFHYVPIFHAMPPEISTMDTNKYSITFIAAPDCSFAVTNGQKFYHVAAGGTITLSPEHMVAIQAMVKPETIASPRRERISGRKP